jgi:hypothetical protein
MGKQLSFVYKDNEYCLEYTRKSVEQMERKGFKVSDIMEKPVTTLPTLFAGAFLAHHRNIKPEVVDEIFSKMKGKDNLIEKLAEMYNEPIMALIDEPEEAEGNLEWTASW